jgi:hypothetical protein
LSDPGACGVTNRCGIKLCHQILTSNYARTDQLHGEVHVFAEPLRGIGEGHYAWDLMPNSTMTNAAVAQQVKKQDANTLMLKYKDGEKTIVVPSDATVVNLIPGDKADLVPGAKIFIPRWAKTADGTWEATVALVGRDGITPPM